MIKLCCAVFVTALAAAPLRAASAVPSSAAGPGEPVANPAAEKTAAAALAGLTDPSAKPGKWKSIVCGPLVWKRLAGKEPALAARGVKTSLRKPGQENGLEARTFSPEHDDAEFYKSPAVQQTMRTFAAGKARSASQKERDAFYGVYAGEIKGRPLTAVEAGEEVLLVYIDKDELWLDLPAAAPAAAAPPAAVSVSTASQTVDDIYTADGLRDPFLKLGATMRSAGSASYTPEDFNIHNLTLRGIMKDRGADYALFTDTNFGISFILRRGKLYDPKGKPVAGVTGSMNLRQKSAYLKTAESDVQTFKLGETQKD